MTTFAQPRPAAARLEPITLVLADEVDAELETARLELEGLADELRVVSAEADALEAEAGTEFDPDAHEFVAIRLLRFLDGLRSEMNSEIASLMAIADRSSVSRRPITANWGPLLATRATRRTADSPPPDPSALVPDPFRAVANQDLGGALDADIEVDVGYDAFDRDLDADFWHDDAKDTGRRHFFRVTRAVALQAAAVLLVLTVVLIRIG